MLTLNCQHFYKDGIVSPPNIFSLLYLITLTTLTTILHPFSLSLLLFCERIRFNHSFESFYYYALLVGHFNSSVFSIISNLLLSLYPSISLSHLLALKNHPLALSAWLFPCPSLPVWLSCWLMQRLDSARNRLLLLPLLLSAKLASESPVLLQLLLVAFLDLFLLPLVLVKR